MTRAKLLTLGLAAWVAALLPALGGCHKAPPEPPASAVPAMASVFNPGRPGEGAATELQTNRPALLHCDGKEVTLPATLWFDQAAAPEGESPFTFRPQANGVYVVSFAGSTACTFTDQAGRALVPVDIQLVMGEAGSTKTVFKLSLMAQRSGAAESSSDGEYNK